MRTAPLLGMLLSASLIHISDASANSDATLKEIIKEQVKPMYSEAPPKVSSCLNDELLVSEIEQKLIFQFADALAKKDVAKLNQLSSELQSGFWWNTKPSIEREGIAEFKWDTAKKSSWQTFLTAWSQVDSTEVRIVDFSINPDDRGSDNVPRKISLKLRLDLRGQKDGKKTQARAILRAATTNVDKTWKLSSFTALQGTTLVQNRAPAFVDTTATTNLANAQTYRRTEAIRRGGYALSIADINGDGLQDIFIGMKGAPEIWLGQKDGKFVKLEQNPFANERYIKTAVFADFQNTGDSGVVMTRYIDKPESGVPSPGIDIAIYKNKGGKFELSPQKVNGNVNLREPMPAAVADFNGDGLLDFYIGYPGRQDFSQLGAIEEKPLNQVQGLYMNDGKGDFLDFTDAAIKWNSESDYTGRLFPHSSLAVDLNLDGKQDLLVADDRGNLSPLFMNLGKGTMVESSGKTGIVNRGYSMSLAAGDLDNEGLTDLALTNVYLTEFDRLKKSCSRHFKVDLLDRQGEGLRIFEARKNRRYKEITKDIILDYPGDAPAGVTFIDYNNDGFQDIYVVNGLWSGTNRGQNLGSMFATLATKQEMFYALRSANKFRFMDVLSDFKGWVDNYADANSIQKGDERPSLGGYQHNRLYRNNRDGTFTEVGFLEGVDSIADGYVVARADLNNDGKPDLVLRNADPGTDEYKFPVVQIFENHLVKAGNSITLKFKGMASNRDGFGLFAKATIGKSTQVQHLIANSGSVQDQKILHFGMGSAKLVKRLEVHWPSGKIQTLKNLKPGYHMVEEPASGINVGGDTINATEFRKTAAH